MRRKNGYFENEFGVKNCTLPAQVTKKVKDTVARDVKTVGEIPAENIRARYASQIDPPVVNRFKQEPYKISD